MNKHALKVSIIALGIAIGTSAMAEGVKPFSGYNSTGADVPKSKVLTEKPQAKAAPKEPAKTAKPQAKVKPSGKAYKRPQLSKKVESYTLESGQRQVLELTLGHLNRIETPFKRPKVHTISPESDLVMYTEGNVLYISPYVSTIHTVFVSPHDDSSISIPLIVVPDRLAPRDIKINVKGYKPKSKKAKKAVSEKKEMDLARAALLEKKGTADYERMLTDIAITLAKGEAPNGYAQGKAKSSDNFCYQPGLNFTPKQKLSGFSQKIVISKVENKSGDTVDFKEQSCFVEGVRLVSSYPNTRLEPGSSAEVYVIVGNEIYHKPNKRKRVY